MRKRNALLGGFLVLAVLALGSSASLGAQAEATSGSLRGTVSDTSGAVVPDAKVTVKNVETGYTRDTRTGDDGYFNIPLLPIGRYEVRVEKQGFSTAARTNIAVSVGGVALLDIELKIGATTEVVEVQAATPLVEATRTQVSSVVDESAVRTLPLHGRNYLDFVLLTPGVVRDNNRGGDISFGGLKGTYNSLQIDGVDNNNNFFGQSLGRTGVRAPFQFSQEAVAEFQVKTNSYGAEHGRAGGAVINVVTKAGTNDWHGALFTYFRDNKLNANKWELNKARRAKPTLRVWQFGGVASGPIVRDKAFWLFNYDAQRRKEPNSILCSNLPAACAAARADSFLAPLIQDYQRLLDQDVFLGKGDWRITSNHNVSIRYNYQRFTGGNQENSGDTSVRQHTGDSLVRTHTLSGNLISTFGPRWLNEFRAQWGRDGEPGRANATEPELRFFQGGTLFLQLGRNNFSPRETTINRGQLVDNVSYLRGRHTLKFGADFNIERILNFFPGLFGGQYSFNCLADFQDDRIPNGSSGCAGRMVGAYVQNFAGSGTTGPTTRPNITEYSWFAQDEFRVRPDLTVTLGVRHDLQTNAKPRIVNPSPELSALGVNTGQMNTDTNNFGPRVGFAWSRSFLNHQSVVRGGYGIYYGRTPSIMTATATSTNGLQVISMNLGSASPLLPAYPATFSGPPSGVQPASIYTFNQNYVQPYVQQGSFGIEMELAKDWSVGSTYLVVKGTRLSRSNNVNLDTPVPTTFPVSTGGTFTVQRFPAARPAPSFARVTEFQSNGKSIYHGWALTMNKRFSHHFQAAANYTLSKSIDDRPDSTSVVPFNAGDDSKMVQDPKNIPGDRGLSDQDFRHRFVLAGLWHLNYLNQHENLLLRHTLGYWSFGTIFTAQNGAHYSTLAGGDPNADGNSFTDRVPGFARNTNTLPAQISWDIRVGRDFPIYEQMKLTFLFEAFNLLNRPNFRGANNTAFNLAAGVFVPVTGFSPANPTDRFTGTYDHPGGGSAFPGPGPRTLQLALKLTW